MRCRRSSEWLTLNICSNMGKSLLQSVNLPLRWTGGSLAVLLCLLPSAACKSGYPVSAKQERPGDARQVKTVRVSQVSMERTVTVTGTLAALDQATISSKIPGRLQTLAVDLG